MAKKSPYESEELSDSIFMILMAVTEPRHGYGIMQMLEEKTEKNLLIGPATMYTTLKKMKAAEWIEAIAEEEGKIVYQITEKGKAILLKDFARRKKLVKLADEILGVIQ